MRKLMEKQLSWLALLVTAFYSSVNNETQHNPLTAARFTGPEINRIHEKNILSVCCYVVELAIVFQLPIRVIFGEFRYFEQLFHVENRLTAFDSCEGWVVAVISMEKGNGSDGAIILGISIQDRHLGALSINKQLAARLDSCDLRPAGCLKNLRTKHPPHTRYWPKVSAAHVLYARYTGTLQINKSTANVNSNFLAYSI
ncbi:hypothetical protein WN51_09858 [Melipona quadrifasciata]|uniref:Uncharacterized protein n=1 Tax=Melipona quadrifasciata TaxID=166423 RepID=A0A0N0BID4_9HYME|nr:hypothetical protein WN51_09858 [Melipona quadrifasciata]